MKQLWERDQSPADEKSALEEQVRAYAKEHKLSFGVAYEAVGAKRARGTALLMASLRESFKLVTTGDVLSAKCGCGWKATAVLARGWYNISATDRLAGYRVAEAEHERAERLVYQLAEVHAAGCNK